MIKEEDKQYIGKMGMYMQPGQRGSTKVTNRVVNIRTINIIDLSNQIKEMTLVYLENKAVLNKDLIKFSA